MSRAKSGRLYNRSTNIVLKLALFARPAKVETHRLIAVVYVGDIHPFVLRSFREASESSPRCLVFDLPYGTTCLDSAVSTARQVVPYGKPCRLASLYRLDESE